MRRQATTGRASLGSLALTRSIAPISYACGSNLHPNPSNPCGTMPRGRPLTGKQSNNCTMPLHGKCFLCIHDQSPRVMPCNEAGHLTRHPLSGGHQPQYPYSFTQRVVPDSLISHSHQSSSHITRNSAIAVIVLLSHCHQACPTGTTSRLCFILRYPTINL